MLKCTECGKETRNLCLEKCDCGGDIEFVSINNQSKESDLDARVQA